jgi:hypothetical protein
LGQPACIHFANPSADHRSSRPMRMGRGMSLPSFMRRTVFTETPRAAATCLISSSAGIETCAVCVATVMVKLSFEWRVYLLTGCHYGIIRAGLGAWCISLKRVEGMPRWPPYDLSRLGQSKSSRFFQEFPKSPQRTSNWPMMWAFSVRTAQSRGVGPSLTRRFTSTPSSRRNRQISHRSRRTAM